MVEADQTSYGLYASFVNESDQILAINAPFEIKDSYYMNKKIGEEANKFFCWDPKRGFLLINKAIEKIATIKEI